MAYGREAERGRSRLGPTLLVAVALSSALASAGCGGPAGEGEADESPLDAYLDEIFGDLGPDEPNPWAVQAEELVAACMTRAGFEYRPDDMAGMGSFTVPAEAGTVDFAEQYGYGLSIPLEGSTTPMLWAGAPTSDAVVWNQEYRRALSPQAQAEYDAALDGSPVDTSAETPLAMRQDSVGCIGRAHAEVYPDQVVGPAELGEVKDAVMGVWLAVESDPRVSETLAAWSTCMADAGHPGLTQVMDAQNLMYSEVWPRWQDSWAAATQTTLGVTDYDAVRTRIPDGLAELRTAEVELAVADARCREDSGYLEAYRSVELEVESAIVERHRADLDAWVQWIRENRPSVV